MRILLTNDDGIDSVGLHILARAIAPLGEVVVAAPDREFSGAGAAVGALHEMRPEVRRAKIDGIDEVWKVNGPPALCVMFGRLGAFGKPFDLVVSGINPGANVGRAVYHSGTVGAALTARNGGVSGVAVSQAVLGFGIEGQGWDEMLVGQKWDTAAAVAQAYVRGLLQNLPEDPAVVNINVPNVELSEIKGWKHADVGVAPNRTMATAELIPIEGHTDAFDVKMSWGAAEATPKGTDTALIEDGYVTVTNLGRLMPEPRNDLGSAESGLSEFLSELLLS